MNRKAILDAYWVYAQVYLCRGDHPVSVMERLNRLGHVPPSPLTPEDLFGTSAERHYNRILQKRFNKLELNQRVKLSMAEQVSMQHGYNLGFKKIPVEYADNQCHYRIHTPESDAFWHGFILGGDDQYELTTGKKRWR